MGLTMTKDAHEKFHEKSSDLSTKQHYALLRRLGVTREEDAEWHRTHLTLAEQRAQRAMAKALDTIALGEGFLAWCIQQKWLIQRGGAYFATVAGARELSERFGIQV
jgi:hypothetical protein